MKQGSTALQLFYFFLSALVGKVGAWGRAAKVNPEALRNHSIPIVVQ
jgi:hypothetical protein